MRQLFSLWGQPAREDFRIAFIDGLDRSVAHEHKSNWCGQPRKRGCCQYDEGVPSQGNKASHPIANKYIDESENWQEENPRTEIVWHLRSALLSITGDPETDAPTNENCGQDGCYGCSALGRTAGTMILLGKSAIEDRGWCGKQDFPD